MAGRSVFLADVGGGVDSLPLPSPLPLPLLFRFSDTFDEACGLAAAKTSGSAAFCKENTACHTAVKAGGVVMGNRPICRIDGLWVDTCGEGR